MSCMHEASEELRGLKEEKAEPEERENFETFRDGLLTVEKKEAEG